MINIDVKHTNYDIILERGCLNHLSDYIDTNRKVFLLTDDFIPDELINNVSKQFNNIFIYKVPHGEEAKSFKVYEAVLQSCLNFHMSRKDLLIALGGGVIGDLGGFVASTYMRGIEFISMPTTTLSQIDSSIGGKVAINLGMVKNIVGVFNHPSKVLIDFDTLNTLPKRHVINGLIEAIKAGLIHDPKIFELFEDDYEKHLEEIIYLSLLMKKKVVEMDETEHGIRKTLNFGHSIGHGIEAYFNLKDYYHGECVAMGMLYFIEDDALKQRVLNLYDKLNIKATANFDNELVYKHLCNDKKASGNHISIVKVREIGHAYIEEMKISDLKDILERGI